MPCQCQPQMLQACACLIHFARRLLRYGSVHDHGPSEMFFRKIQAAKLFRALALRCVLLLQRYLPTPLREDVSGALPQARQVHICASGFVA